MDFKNYVRMMLEAEKAKDQDEERTEDQDDEDEDDDSDEDEDDEAQASVKTNKTGCTGGEASCKTDDDDEDDDEDDEDEDEDEKCPDCGKSPCECKKENLKEAMIYSARYARGEKQAVLSEETRILCEDIKNNSASKYLSKLSKKAEKEAAKYSKKGMSKEAATSKKAASALKEASNKLYKCETRYKAGDPTAKKEYKAICKQYSKELKTLGKTARGLKGLVFTLISGTILLGAVGTTVVANNADGGIIDKISRAITEFKGGDTKRGLSILGDIAENDKNFVKSVVDGSEFKGTDWAGKKADFDAQDAGWDNAAHRDNNIGYKAGKAIGDTARAAGKGVKDTWRGLTQGASKSIEDTSRGLKQGLSGK